MIGLIVFVLFPLGLNLILNSFGCPFSFLRERTKNITKKKKKKKKRKKHNSDKKILYGWSFKNILPYNDFGSQCLKMGQDSKGTHWTRTTTNGHRPLWWKFLIIDWTGFSSKRIYNIKNRNKNWTSTNQYGLKKKWAGPYCKIWGFHE